MLVPDSLASAGLLIPLCLYPGTFQGTVQLVA